MINAIVSRARDVTRLQKSWRRYSSIPSSHMVNSLVERAFECGVGVRGDGLADWRKRKRLLMLSDVESSDYSVVALMVNIRRTGEASTCFR